MSSKEEIHTLERQISFPAIVASKEDSVMKLRTENYDLLLGFVVMCTKNYLEYCYPHNVGIAVQFSIDLIADRPTWKAADFVNLYQFIRRRQDIDELKVFGNQITPQKLMELVTVYEDVRAQAFEQHYREQRGKVIEENKTLNPLAEKLALKMREKGNVPTGDENLGKLMDAQRAKSEREGYGRNVTQKQSHNDFFEK